MSERSPNAALSAWQSIAWKRSGGHAQRDRQYGTGLRTPQSGFTLIELMIVVVIVGILITVALPSFQSQAVRTNQAAAQSAMMDIANVQEQYFLATRSYLDKAALEATGYTLDPDVANNYTYTMTVAAGPPSTFLLTLVPSSSAGGDATFTINSSGNKTPAEYWDR